ncbi:MAG: universal stress protein [Ferruginibacter sp.]
MESLKILLPTDFSKEAQFAYAMANKLKEKIAVDIHFLHVLQVPDTVSINEWGTIETCGEIDIAYLQQQKDHAEKQLLQLIPATDNENYHAHLELGQLTTKILQFSEIHQIDIIVMGTKGATGLKELLSGTETQHIARYSKIPLLSVMCDRSTLAINEILLAYDFGFPQKEQLNVLHRIASAFNARINLLHIAALHQKVDAALITQHMHTFAALNGFENYACHFLQDTDIENGVVHFNQMHDMNMIAIGTKGKGGLLHKSAMEKLVQHLQKPILSFHLID